MGPLRKPYLVGQRHAEALEPDGEFFLTLGEIGGGFLFAQYAPRHVGRDRLVDAA